MTKVERDQSFPTAAARCRDADPGRPLRHMPKVLLGRRHAPQIHAGEIRLSRRTRGPLDRLSCRRRPNSHADTKKKLLERVSERQLARSFALAAIRELSEETGLLLGARRGEPPAAPRGPWTASPRRTFMPILSGLHSIGRAITPPGARRFDARFLTMDASAIAHRVEGVIGPTPNSSNSPGWRSRMPPSSTCRRSPE